MIDLHCHSTFSDGSHTPEVLIEKAKLAGLKTLALTDHDTIDGIARFKEAGFSSGINLISGIELSTRWKKYDIHILGYNINPESPQLLNLLQQQNENRINRAKTIGERLAQVGVENAYEKACVFAGHHRVGRPHFAQVLLQEGKVKEAQLAFKKYLGRGKIAYIPTQWISIEEAISAIIEAGGHAVLAHPLKYKLTQSRLQELILLFRSAGGHGLEVVSGDTNEKMAAQMAGFCLRYELLASSGSDFHGDNLSRISLGKQRQLPVNCMPIWDQWTS